ncbi:NAD(P)-binding domain-containing protein [Roseibium salinum]|nr:NAD(P)-binding domain-containing protein [Roseibium salinum]
MSDVIGFIGLGFMGLGMASNIRKGGYDLWVKGRRNRAPVESLVSQGAQEAASPREMAEKNAISFTCACRTRRRSKRPCAARTASSPAPGPA